MLKTIFLFEEEEDKFFAVDTDQFHQVHQQALIILESLILHLEESECFGGAHIYQDLEGFAILLLKNIKSMQNIALNRSNLMNAFLFQNIRVFPLQFILLF